ncbi:hypothetical protein NA56DRAFT_581299, partial [Hyaloscypha hepaticicola]
HNQFPSDTPFLQVDELSDGFKELYIIITKYNTPFQLRALHQYSIISKGQVLLGTSITGLGYWTRNTLISDIDLDKSYNCEIAADIIDCTGKGRIRYTILYSEFREGLPVNIGKINNNFFTEFTDCLWAKGLENSFGLEVKQDQSRKMIEFSFNTGLLLVREEEVNQELKEGTGQFTLRVIV